MERPTLPRSFYLRDALSVARDLLGKELVHHSPEGTASGIIVEAEAYRGALDAASHARGGVPTGRTRIMYEEGGHAYVYFIYGMYWCLNVTTREKGVAEGVLIRALEPRQGIGLMRSRRRIRPGKKDVELANGPGKLCAALGIDGTLYGADLCSDTLFLREPEDKAEFAVGTSPRRHVDYAGEAKDYPWRFFIVGNRCVSGGAGRASRR